MIQILNADELSLTRDIAFAFFKESKIDGKLDFDHFCKSWGSLIQLDMACIMVYIDSSKKPRGIIGGTLTTCLMTNEPIAQEAFWWTEPELRGTPAGLRLLTAWWNYMAAKGAVRVYVGNLMEVEHEAMARLYTRLGFRPLETHYVRNTR